MRSSRPYHRQRHNIRLNIAAAKVIPHQSSILQISSQYDMTKLIHAMIDQQNSTVFSIEAKSCRKMVNTLFNGRTGKRRFAKTHFMEEQTAQKNSHHSHKENDINNRYFTEPTADSRRYQFLFLTAYIGSIQKHHTRTEHDSTERWDEERNGSSAPNRKQHMDTAAQNQK